MWHVATSIFPSVLPYRMRSKRTHCLDKDDVEPSALAQHNRIVCVPRHSAQDTGAGRRADVGIHVTG